MKSELKTNGAAVEVWYNGAQIGEVVGAEGPGVHVISKHPMLSQWHADADIKLVEIKIASEPPSAQPFPSKR